MRAFNCDRGVTLAETMIAVLIALIGVFSLGSVIFQATATSKNQGTEVTRSTIYAQDKTEKLLSLNFSDCTQSASSQPATCNATGITATGWTQGLLAGGALSPVQTTCPTSGASVGYVDYLDPNGIQLAGTSCAVVSGAVPAYIREWQITDLSSTGGPTIKNVTVAVYSQNAIGAVGGKPIVILTSLLSNPN
jgi:Tfp pilus assembly protein PilV